MPNDYAIDMWSIGCTLYELYTGKILFTGDSNNQMLRAIIEIRGKMSTKLYRRGQLWQMHFDDMGNFVSQERDKVLGKVRNDFLFVSRLFWINPSSPAIRQHEARSCMIAWSWSHGIFGCLPHCGCCCLSRVKRCCGAIPRTQMTHSQAEQTFQGYAGSALLPFLPQVRVARRQASVATCSPTSSGADMSSPAKASVAAVPPNGSPGRPGDDCLRFPPQ